MSSPGYKVVVVPNPLELTVRAVELEAVLESVARQVARLGKGAGLEGDGAIVQLADSLTCGCERIAEALDGVAQAIRDRKGGGSDQA